MENQIVSGVVTIATAIVGIAIIATLVSNKAQTSTVIQSATGGFAQDIEAAVSPVTGQQPNSTFTGGGGLSSMVD